MIATLVGLHGPLTGKRFPVRGATLTLGRAADSDVVLATRLRVAGPRRAAVRGGRATCCTTATAATASMVNGRKVAVHRGCGPAT